MRQRLRRRSPDVETVETISTRTWMYTVVLKLSENQGDFFQLLDRSWKKTENGIKKLEMKKCPRKVGNIAPQLRVALEFTTEPVCGNMNQLNRFVKSHFFFSWPLLTSHFLKNGRLGQPQNSPSHFSDQWERSSGVTRTYFFSFWTFLAFLLPPGLPFAFCRRDKASQIF